MVFSAPTTTAYGTVTIDATTGVFTYTPNEEARPTAPSFDATTITLTDPSAVPQGTFTTSAGRLGNGSLSLLGQPGSNRYNHVATYFTATNTQTYTLGQSSAPVDSVMIVYNGTFDAASPGANALALNDDGSHPAGVTVTGCAGSAGLCPSLSVNLTAGQTVSIVISTYSPGTPLGLPQSFYSTRPGSFSATPLEDSFDITVTEGHGGSSAVSVTVPIAPALAQGVAL